MPFYVVQPWGRDRHRQATVASIHDTIDDAYARLDAIADFTNQEPPARPRVAVANSGGARWALPLNSRSAVEDARTDRFYALGATVRCRL